MSSKYFPAEIYKVKRDVLYGDKVQYHFVLSDQNSKWNQTFISSGEQLEDLKNKIEQALGERTLSELLRISDEDATFIEEQYTTDNFCRTCSYQRTSNCTTCLFELDSPLERELYLALLRSGIYNRPQYPINRAGKRANMSASDWYDNMLTKVDFYITYKGKRICLYADGITYHSTDEQLAKDKHINEQLKSFGYIVLRYSGEEIRSNIEGVISDIKNLIK